MTCAVGQVFRPRMTSSSQGRVLGWVDVQDFDSLYRGCVWQIGLREFLISRDLKPQIHGSEIFALIWGCFQQLMFYTMEITTTALIHFNSVFSLSLETQEPHKVNTYVYSGYFGGGDYEQMVQQPEDTECPDLALAQRPLFFLKSPSLLTIQEKMTNGELEYYFVTGQAVIAPFFGLRSPINKTTSFEIVSRLSEQRENCCLPHTPYLPMARRVALDLSAM